MGGGGSHEAKKLKLKTLIFEKVDLLCHGNEKPFVSVEIQSAVIEQPLRQKLKQYQQIPNSCVRVFLSTVMQMNTTVRLVIIVWNIPLINRSLQNYLFIYFFTKTNAR